MLENVIKELVEAIKEQTAFIKTRYGQVGQPLVAPEVNYGTEDHPCSVPPPEEPKVKKPRKQKEEPLVVSSYVLDDVNDALQKVIDAEDMDKARSILINVGGAKKLNELKPEKFAEVIVACNEVIKDATGNTL